jgi:anti-anti-sigma factor
VTTRLEIHLDEDVIVLTGELDVSTAPDFDQTIRPLMVDSDGPIAVDMSEVDFMDSAGLRSLINAAIAGGVRIVNPSERVQRLIRLTGVGTLLGV